jgi:hypothetical protein
LQVVRGVREDQVNGSFGQGVENPDAIAFQDLIERQAHIPFRSRFFRPIKSRRLPAVILAAFAMPLIFIAAFREFLIIV